MFVSQVLATVIYTLFKTLLLIVIARVIESLCSWTKRYDIAKIFERGSYPVVFTAVFSHRNYRNYWSLPMFTILLLALAIETVTNLIPTIAIKYMPFQPVSFTRGDNQYFKYMYNTPTQAAQIPSLNYSTDNAMRSYCGDMGLCTNGIYKTHVLAISPTMQVEQIPYNFEQQKFVTDQVNISSSICLPSLCRGSDSYFATNSSHHAFHNVSGLPSSIVMYHMQGEDSDNGIETIFNASRMNAEYKRDPSGSVITEPIDISPLIPMSYRASDTDIISVTHLSKVLFTNGQETVLLILKVALHNLSRRNYGQQEAALLLLDNTFNNTKALSNITGTFTDIYGKDPNSDPNPQSTVVGYTSYVADNYLSVDIVQRTSYYGSQTILKARILAGVYIITEPLLPMSTNTRFNNQGYLTNYNISKSGRDLDTKKEYSVMRESGFYDSMFDAFNEPPTNDLFMYAVLDSSDHTLYGKEGYQDIVADISPVFVGIICAFLLVALVIYGISRYTKNPLYFFTLYQAVGNIDIDGRVENPNNAISKLAIKDGVLYSGEHIMVSKRNI